MGLFDGTMLERPVLCERCGLDVKLCKCPPLQEPDVAPQKQTLRLSLEKRKKGKLVTVVKGFSCRPDQIEDLLKILKNACGAGGSSSPEELEIQGDHLDAVKHHLVAAGYKIR